jgi:hypothetical protein
MDDTRPHSERPHGIEGADDAGLGLTPPPEPVRPAAPMEDEVHLVPGATYGDRIADNSKPWSTSLAAQSDQAEVANEPAEDDQFPTGDDEAL